MTAARVTALLNLFSLIWLILGHCVVGVHSRTLLEERLGTQGSTAQDQRHTQPNDSPDFLRQAQQQDEELIENLGYRVSYGKQAGPEHQEREKRNVKTPNMASGCECAELERQTALDAPHSDEDNNVTKRTTSHPVPPEIEELRSTCGTPNLHKRIVGGADANPTEWTWMAALLRTDNGEYYCGGALISSRYVVTAAHCTIGFQATNITIRLGAYNMKEPTQEVKDILVSRIRRHPDFQRSTYMNDIAVLRLKQAARFTEHIRPICLPVRPGDTFFGKKATVIGWGTRAFGGPYSDILQQVNLTVWNNTQCKEKFVQHITDVFLCAGPRRERGDACQGDSGGPLMVQSKTKQWTLVGVVSWGIRCGEPGIPGIYTRVSKFLDYIYEHAV